MKRIVSTAKFFYLQRIRGFTVSNEPWLDPEAKDWLEERLRASRSYLEFGSGGSTRLSGQMGVPTITVEGDRFFARAVRSGLAEGHNVNIIEAPIGLTGPWGIPLPGSPSTRRVRKWRNYIDMPFDVIEANQTSFPDLVLVDGRFRRACALQTALKAKRASTPVDVFFDDYFLDGRTHYHVVEQCLGSPIKVGKAAHFKITGSERVSAADVDLAISDYR